jgi:translation initiation factor IF-2
VVDFSKTKEKLSLSGKITLPTSMDRKDILNKLSKNSGGFITRKGESEVRVVENTSSNLSYSERQRRVKAIEIQEKQAQIQEKLNIEEEALKTLSNEVFQPISPKIPHEVALDTTPSAMTDALKHKVKIEIKHTPKEEPKKQDEVPVFTFKQGGDTIIQLEDIEKETPKAKVDKRDKSLIEKMMKHYKYLEFDSDVEIEKLQKGLELRTALEEKRKGGQVNDEEVAINSVASENDEEVVKIRREAYFSRHNRRPLKKRDNSKVFIQKEIELYDKNIVLDVARNLAMKVEDLTRKLKQYGIYVKENDIIDGDAAELVIEEMGHIVKRKKRLTAEDKLKREQIFANLKSVPPVVTIMGHVDHGKTTLLDALRNANVASGEAGGITQHIGAYQTILENGKKITFIDTPGHEAFTSIRERGANITHVIVLVVAADDGVMPQTVEAIKHAKKAAVPIVVAINKIDRPNADVQKVKNALLAYELVPEDLGGDVIFVPISAKTGENLDQLCEAILLQAEVLDAKAEWEALASGIILEGKLDKQKGVIASLLVQNGTLKVGDVIVADSYYCKIRLMTNDKGESIKIAEPSTPVEVYGLPDVPTPGASFNVVETEKLAKEIAEHRREKKMEKKKDVKSAFSNFFKPKEEKKYINIVIRADVQSTIEAIKYSIWNIKIPKEIEIKIMQSSVGQVSEADITLAKTYNAIIFAFSTKLGSKEEEFAKKNGVIIKQHSIIYNIVEDVKEIVISNLSPIIKDEVIGEVEVRAIFDIVKSGKIAGSMVKKGVAKRNAIVKVFRNGIQIAEGKLKTLKHFKEDVKELAQGNECGIQIEGFEEFIIGDFLQIIERTEEKRTL